MLSPVPRRSDCGAISLIAPRRISLPRYASRVGLRIVLFEACSAFTRVTACTLALSPYFVTPFTEGFNHLVTSMIAPVASGWSGLPGGTSTHWESAALPRRTAVADDQKRESYSRVRPTAVIRLGLRTHPREMGPRLPHGHACALRELCDLVGDAPDHQPLEIRHTATAGDDQVGLYLIGSIQDAERRIAVIDEGGRSVNARELCLVYRLGDDLVRERLLGPAVRGSAAPADS